ncbi:MAG: hypothetical protein Q9217_000188 [Psora testacea]
MDPDTWRKHFEETVNKGHFVAIANDNYGPMSDWSVKTFIEQWRTLSRIGRVDGGVRKSIRAFPFKACLVLGTCEGARLVSRIDTIGTTVEEPHYRRLDIFVAVLSLLFQKPELKDRGKTGNSDNIMGPRQTPRKQRAAGDYGNIGTRGRRTGVELKDTGVRDEHGIEPIPSFSSPVKDGLKSNGVLHEETTYTATYTADDSMEIDQSTAPEPTDVIRSVKHGVTRLSIPRSVSPKKNLMNGSPRRSAGGIVGPMSSPSKNIRNSIPSHAPVNRTLDFSVDVSQTAASQARPKRSKPTNRTKRGKRKGPFDLSMSEEDDDQHSANDSIDPSLIDNGTHEDYTPQLADEPIDQEDTMESIETDEPPFPPTEGPVLGEDAITSAMAPPPPTRKRGGRPAKASVAPVASMDEPQLSQLAPSVARRGRLPKKTKVYKDVEAVQAQSLKTTGGEKAKQAPTERDPNARPKTAKAHGKPPSRGGSVAPRAGPYTVARSETPATDGGALTTRSGRTSIKPLASWRGEKAIFGQRQSSDLLPGIQEVVRTDEVMPPPKKRAGGYRPTKKRLRSQALEEIEEEEEEEKEELEPWEADRGIQHAMVMQWNPDLGKYDEDNTEQLEIAYAADAIEMRDIQGATFKFAKTLTLPFFGSGMVHLPPGGEKRVKNSRKMQMVFFVYYGRVTVNVGTPTTTFSIGKGGQWQVPRGNFYSIINESETQPARLFFAQGCQWSGEIEEGATMAE